MNTAPEGACVFHEWIVARVFECSDVQQLSDPVVSGGSSYGLIGYAFEWKQVDSVSASSYSFSSEQSNSRWIDVSVGVFTVERVPALDDAVSQEVMTDESLSWLEAKHLLDKRWILHFTEIDYSPPGEVYAYRVQLYT